MQSMPPRLSPVLPPPMPAAANTQVGCIGFCMGGALTLAAAQHAGVDCGVAFYGTPSVGAA